MIRSPCLATLLAALALPLAAQAQTSPDNAAGRTQFEIAGVAQPLCLVGQPVATSVANARFSADGVSGGTLDIVALSDPETARGNAAAATIVVPVTCNAAHDLAIGSSNGGLMRIGGGRAQIDGFDQFIPYAVQYGWAGRDMAGTSDNTAPLALSVPHAGKGDLAVAITLDGTSAPLVAGNYEDVLLIEIAAAM